MKDLQIKIIKKLIELSQQLFTRYKYHMEQTENSKKIYEMAKSLLGKDASPINAAPSGYACAETVWWIVYHATGYKIGGGNIISTIKLYECLENDTRFIKVEKLLPGDIRLTVTGTGNGNLPNAHAGIDGYYGVISNNSENGLLQQKLSFEAWRAIYEVYGGFKTHGYRMI